MLSVPSAQLSERRAVTCGRIRCLGAFVLASLLMSGVQARAEPGIRLEPFSAERYDSARQSGSPFVLEFTADWCLPCKKLEEKTLTDPMVIREAEGVRFLKVDLTNPDRRTELIMHSFKIPGAPTTIVYGPDGKERTRRVGFIEAREFAKMLADAKAGGPASPTPSGPPSTAVRKI